MISDAQKTVLNDLGAYLTAAAQLLAGAEVPVEVSDEPDWAYIDQICGKELEIAKFIDREDVRPGFVIIKYREA
jgi:hypothetical protein